MTTLAFSVRNKILTVGYRGLKHLLFLVEPETIHDRVVNFGSFLGQYAPFRTVTAVFFDYFHPALEQNILGIDFKNPIGLAAGFDKNAELGSILGSVGFGFAELGSITARPCPGNPRPRLWRLKESQGLVVWYGLKNDGVDAIRKRIEKTQAVIPFGTSIAMTNIAENIETRLAIHDYLYSFIRLKDIGAYFTLNISCPNAAGSQMFLAPHRLDYLLDILDEVETSKPIFVKLSPDLGLAEASALVEVILRHRVHGVICSNLTRSRANKLIKEEGAPLCGGVSGKPTQALSDRLIKHIYRQAGSRLVIIGCGGVFSAADAYKKIRAGASLVQIVTGMIFTGPQVVSSINLGLVKLLQADGYSNISEAVGADAH